MSAPERFPALMPARGTGERPVSPEEHPPLSGAAAQQAEASMATPAASTRGAEPGSPGVQAGEVAPAAAVASKPTLGRLVLMPNALDLGTGLTVHLEDVLPRGAIRRAASLRHWVVENAKSARAFLNRVAAIEPLSCTLQDMAIEELRRSPKGRGQPPINAAVWQGLLAPALAGHDVGLLSEAGLPAVADPGSELVAQAHTLGLPIEPWAGPSSLMMALAASGLGGQNFAFVGYLPVDGAARTARIRELEAWSRKAGQAQLAIETPYRNVALMQALLAALQPGTRLAIASGLTLPTAWCRSLTVAQWRKSPARFDERMPAVFAWSAAG